MNDSNYLKVYLRKTNGSGQLILINPQLTARSLHHYTSQIFNIPYKSFSLISKNIKILDTTQITVQNLQLQSGSIIHIQQILTQQKNSQELKKSTLQLRVFCQGSLYMYKAQNTSTISDLKHQMQNLISCHQRDITVVHLGHILKDDDTLTKSQIKDKDLLSVVITHVNFDRRSSTKLKPKIAQSMTFAASQQADSNYQPFAKQIMRKSSMKSSQQQSRQFRRGRQKPLLKTIRPKSQLTRSNNSLEIENKQEQQQKNLQLNNFPWLTNQKVIQTESINFDDPQQQQQAIQKWTQCKIQLSNQQNTRFYTIQCNQTHDLNSVKTLLTRLEFQSNKNQQYKFEILFANQNEQQMADQGKKIIDIAKTNKIQIIHAVTFHPISL